MGTAGIVPALRLVSGGGTGPGHAVTDGLLAGPGHAVTDGLLAGPGVAVQYPALGQAGPESGLSPATAGRVAAVLLLLPAATRHTGRLRLPPRRTPRHC
ncbi:hypothetical protein [Streptomyces sp. b94]|uniref:hypothetical protein n=1 Tax=Streptomyces sp. b94 TaxID=1827634 RepID=UPI001FFDD26C|nr:hypothetical protein [Streptomyces sp. b94]